MQQCALAIVQAIWYCLKEMLVSLIAEALRYKLFRESLMCRKWSLAGCLIWMRMKKASSTNLLKITDWTWDSVIIDSEVCLFEACCYVIGWELLLIAFIFGSFCWWIEGIVILVLEFWVLFPFFCILTLYFM